MRPIYRGSGLTARSYNRPLPPDLTISPKPIYKKIMIVAIAMITVLLGLYYFSGNVKDYVKLSFTFIINRMRAM